MLPQRLDPRLRILAEELTHGAPAPRERVARTLGYLQSHCRYALRVGRFRSQDPVAEFVFDKRRGYCEYFASAAALLLRLQGVPTRYVTGFSVRPANLVAGHYVVRESDAHAWIEAFLPGVGWTEADPTPAGDYAEVHGAAQASWSAALGEWLQAGWAALSASLRQAGGLGSLLWLGRRLMAGLRFLCVDHPVRGAGGCLVLFLLFKRGWLVRFARRRRPANRRESGSGPPELLEALAQLERVWARLGCPRPANRGLFEHADALPPERAPATVSEVSREMARAYYRVSFGGMAMGPGELAELRARVARLR
jgi:hypothetical protein